MNARSLADHAEDNALDALNAKQRDLSHVVLGAAICGVMVLATTALAATQPTAVAPGAREERKPLLHALWPALFSVSTLAALRVWNAPSSPARTRAVWLWGFLQAANLTLTALPLRSPRARLFGALASAGFTSVYVRAAAEVDEKAALMTAPSGFAGLSAFLADNEARLN